MSEKLSGEIDLAKAHKTARERARMPGESRQRLTTILRNRIRTKRSKWRIVRGRRALDPVQGAQAFIREVPVFLVLSVTRVQNGKRNEWSCHS